jgi:hypothetical protein
MRLELEIIRGRQDVGKRYPVVEGAPLVLGRQVDVDIYLASAAVGRRHCEVWRSGDEVWVRDNQSRGGTFRNNGYVRQDGERLEVDDRLKVADFTLRLGLAPIIDPGWQSWNGGIIVRLVLQARQDRGVLPVLADGLEEAGCVEAGVLAHLRGPGEHFGGCCVLDRLEEAWGIRPLRTNERP